MHIKKMMMALAAGSLAIAAQALTLSVKDVKIAQRYPWNGLVDIDYTVVCDDADADVYVYPVGYDVDMNVSVAPRTLTGDGANGQAVKAGTHRMTWDMATDMGANYNRAKFSMKMHAYANAAPYLVIDLSAGAEAEKYEVSYLSEMPDTEWPIEYKTTKFVLKLVTPGTFTMGSPEEEAGRAQNTTSEMIHKVTLTQPFYMGVFEMTQKQWELVMGSNPAYYKGESRPVEQVSYDMIRGNTLGEKWPEHRQVDASSFIGRLRSRTGLTFDLPTEAQWEYTCRAGTGSAMNNGKNLNGDGEQYESSGATIYWSTAVNDIARYSYNYYSGSKFWDNKGGYDNHTAVGSYMPNAWGFYDMHGNVSEWCLDWWQQNLTTSPATDPVGTTAGTWFDGGYWRNYLPSNNYGKARVYRGGYMWDNASNLRSAFRLNTYSSNKSYSMGFRVACLPAE